MEAKHDQVFGPARKMEGEEHAAAEAHAGPSCQKPQANQASFLPARMTARTVASPASWAAEESQQPGRPCLHAHHYGKCCNDVATLKIPSCAAISSLCCCVKMDYTVMLFCLITSALCVPQ